MTLGNKSLFRVKTHKELGEIAETACTSRHHSWANRAPCLKLPSHTQKIAVCVWEYRPYAALFKVTHSLKKCCNKLRKTSHANVYVWMLCEYLCVCVSGGWILYLPVINTVPSTTQKPSGSCLKQSSSPAVAARMERRHRCEIKHTHSG